MSEPRRKYCIFGCDALVTLGVPLHRFPNPDKHPDLFAAWIAAIGDRLTESDPKKIFKNKRICDHHFDPTLKTTGRRLINSAIPMFNLNGVRQSISTFVESDHSYCRPKRGPGYSLPLTDITNLPGPSRPRTLPATDSAVIEVPSSSTSTSGPFSADYCTALERPPISTSCFTRSETCRGGEPLARFDAGEIQLTKRTRKMENEIRRLRQKVKNFKLQLKQFKKEKAYKNFQTLTEHMKEPAKLFTRMQYIEGRKKKKGHRFTLDEKILSLSIFKKSPKAYNLMSKHFTLPSTKILKSMLANIKLTPGINDIIFQELKTTVSKMLPQDRLCTLIFDEMSIAPHIHYNMYTDDLVGFENYGNYKTSNFANHVLVFMVKGIKKNYKQPVAYYFTNTLKSAKLKEIIIDVITNIQATGLTIIATVCDQSSANVSAINSLISEAKTAYLQAGKEWRREIISVNNKDIIPLFDVPHLLKGIRNNILNKEMQFVHENILKVIKWEHIQRVYEADRSDGELRYLSKLTNEHVDPQKIKKMRVKNAAQVLSRSMAVATKNLVARRDVPSECMDLIPFLLLIDNLFDSLNASTFSPPNGKIYRAAVKRNSPHHKLWQDALKMFKTIKFMVNKSDGEKIEKSVPTINNFMKTIEGFKSLWQLLSKKYSFDAMLTRNFNQDPLENFFGCVRNLGARNVMPNCMGFEGAFKTLLLNNFSTKHSLNANCEDDTNECLQSLTFLLKRDKTNAPSQSQNIVIDQPLNVMQNTENISDSGADQRAYVCGWALTKCLQKVVKGCKNCKSKLLGNSDHRMNQYIRAKEYCKNKRWLCYPSECLVACFQDIQNVTVAFLNNDCHEKNIKERIKAFVDIFTDFSFLDCQIHGEKVRDYFINTTIQIIIYSWCRTVNRILQGKITYDGEDSTKKAAQMYFNKYKHYK